MRPDAEDRRSPLLRNAAGSLGVAMRYQTDTLPFFTLWKNTDTEADGYVTGLRAVHELSLQPKRRATLRPRPEPRRWW